MLLVLVEEVCHREVVELQAHTSDDTRLTPTERELNLVVTLLLQVPVYINRTIFRIRLYIRANLLRIKVSHRSKFTSRTHQSILREKVAWLGTKFTAHYVFVKTGITIDTYMAQISLRSLCYAHLQIDRIAINIDFSRFDTREHITIIIVEVRNSVIIFIQALTQYLLVIYIALLHAEQCFEIS